MKKIYWIKFNKYRKVKDCKIYVFSKILVFSIICNICSSKDEKIFKKEESNDTLKILDLINNMNV